MLGKEYHEWMKQMLAKADKHLYLIERYQDHSKYFFYDMFFLPKTDVEVTKVIWTPSQRQAFLFESEEQVEEFKAEYISPRKVSIVRVPKPLNLVLVSIG